MENKLFITHKQLAFINEEKRKSASELSFVNIELAFYKKEKQKRANELIIANRELDFQNKEKEKRAAELIIANKELAFQNKEKKYRAAELIIANRALDFQIKEKEKQTAKLIIANKELIVQSEERRKNAAKLIIANRKLASQNENNEKRAVELIIANNRLAFQSEEKEKRAAELIIANQELKNAEEQFRLVIEAAPYAMVLVNGDGFITLVNLQTEKIFQYKRDELIDEKLEIIIPERFHKEHVRYRNHYLKNPKLQNLGTIKELFLKRKNGSEVQVEISLNPIDTDRGKIILTSIIDITERKIQEATLKKHNKELEQFVYVSSHDLQEPLRTVANYMQVFEEDYLELLDDNARNYLTSVKNATKRMSELIKSLLSYSQLGHNKLLAYVNCNRVIESVIADLTDTIKTSGAVIEVAKMPLLNLYEVEIRQVFQNLITNAIKFCKKGSQPKIKISAEQLIDKWKIIISDNGIGISPIYSERIFDLFQRLDTMEISEGNGIGLASCKKIIQLHQGEIWFESTQGEGTKFYFTIPNLIT